MKRLYLSALCVFWGFALPVFSQDINFGPRITSLGNIGVALQDAWSLQANQSGITALKNPVASVSYRNSYLNPELSTQSAVLVYPLDRNIIGLSLQNYGFSAYSEQKIGFTYAKSFGTISAAANINLHQVKIADYGSTQTYSVEFGLQYTINDRLTLGTHIANPNRRAYDTEIDAVIPVRLEFGASYRLSDKVLFNSGAVKELAGISDFRYGLEYAAISWLSFRGGMSVNPFRQFAGFGYQLNDLNVDAAASSHPTLGFSPQIALSYEF